MIPHIPFKAINNNRILKQKARSTIPIHTLMDSEIKYALVKDTSMDINVKYLNKGITLFFSALKQVKISQTSTKL